MTEKDKPTSLSGDHHHHHHHQPPPSSQPQTYPPPQYGTFQGVSNYPPPPPELNPAIGFPHPAPPPGATEYSDPPPPYYPHGYQAVPGYAVAEGRPVRVRRLPCCGLGLGWFLFIFGFLLAGVPWYVGAVLMLCSRVDYREKPGYVACIVAAILYTIAIIFGVSKVVDD
ncbi:unnamed protein product [Lupinus luteus]|uniref:60S ribosomal protein L18a-like protein n=1 Tax=Lupinus luteus TaxID=3873 RepID=A0AAV1WLK4_LUPLU